MCEYKESKNDQNHRHHILLIHDIYLNVLH